MTIPFMLFFAAIIVILQPFFMLFHLFGKADSVMLLLNILLNRNLKIFAGMRCNVIFDDQLPSDRPIILVANHQSMFDIPMLYEIFARFKLKFIAKLELRHWIPSISWALRNLGSALIKRDDPRQSLSEIKAFGAGLEREKLAVLFFPEGTRARNGVMKKFLGAGIQALVKASPSALIVPAVIEGSWELLRYKFWPVPFGTHVTIKILPPVEPSKYDIKDLPGVLEDLIRAELDALRGIQTKNREVLASLSESSPSLQTANDAGLE